MSEKNAEYWITKLGLIAHPEGGYFKEIYRSVDIADKSLPERFSGNRNFSTAIYFLLKSEEVSVFHRIKSDEIWHFYSGSPLTVYVINQAGDLETHLLGDNPDNNESFQIIVGHSQWFAAKVNNPDTYTLVGCTVSPGFDFHDFEMADREELLKDYPQHQEIINYIIEQ